MTTAKTTASAVLLAPGDRFFLQPVVLDVAAPAASQVELALEEASPFPLAQIYHGFVTAGDRSRAIAFAAYRRRFAAEEQGDWPGASAVLPDFLALLGPVPTQPVLVVHVDGAVARVAAWDGRAVLPVALVARGLPEAADAAIEEIITEVRGTTGLADAAVRHLSGPITVAAGDDGATLFHIGGRETFSLPAAALAEADVRDKSFLEEKVRREATDRRWWQVSLVAGALLLLAVLFELASLGLSLWTGRARSVVNEHADDVRKIEAAQTMATRIEQLGAREQRPLEWLGVAGSVRPRSVQFVRANSRGGRAIEIEAQTGNANDVGNYEAALRGLPEVERVETRDLRAREGMTSFVVALTFKAGRPAVVAGGKP